MNELDKLKSSWQTDPGVSSDRFDRVSAAVQQNTQSTQRVVLHRDVAESAASLVVAIFAVSGIVASRNWIDFVGFALLISVGLGIPVVLWIARRRSLHQVSSSNYADFISDEIDYLRRQVGLLKHVAWWYLLPIFISMTVVSIGISYPRVSIWGLIYLMLFGCFCIYLWRLNQRARKRRLEPLLDYYVKLQAALESGEDSDRDFPQPPNVLQHVATRRPLTTMQRVVFLTLSLSATALVATSGWWIVQNFDPRAGWFVLSTAPLLGLLVLVLTGAYRRSVAG